VDLDGLSGRLSRLSWCVEVEERPLVLVEVPVVVPERVAVGHRALRRSRARTVSQAAIHRATRAKGARR
jgi:hypothetical protein